ncbi:MAG TPA: DUF5681 domain-containing protein [Patescibacteria group bacterium]|nr:DUF5681 domain-containing protein [Patescibacteria group bacterium]
MAEVAKSAPKQRGGFKKGQSGNPKGRPAGSRTKTTLLLDALIDGQAKEIVQSMVNAALGGDTSAGRALLDRLVPPRKDRPVTFALPPITTAADAAAALAGLLNAVAEGSVTPSEATEVSKLVADFVKTLEVSELESRIIALEEHKR